MDQLCDKIEQFQALDDIDHIRVEADQRSHPAQFFKRFFVYVVDLH
jgi:hypothetical protein